VWVSEYLTAIELMNYKYLILIFWTNSPNLTFINELMNYNYLTAIVRITCNHVINKK